jgi:hypothetical protein
MNELARNVTLSEQEYLGFTRYKSYMAVNPPTVSGPGNPFGICYPPVCRGIVSQAPQVDMEFPGNKTVCDDAAYASELFLEAPETEQNWVR